MYNERIEKILLLSGMIINCQNVGIDGDRIFGVEEISDYLGFLQETIKFQQDISVEEGEQFMIDIVKKLFKELRDA